MQSCFHDAPNQINCKQFHHHHSSPPQETQTRSSTPRTKPQKRNPDINLNLISVYQLNAQSNCSPLFNRISSKRASTKRFAATHSFTTSFSIAFQRQPTWSTIPLISYLQRSHFKPLNYVSHCKIFSSWFTWNSQNGNGNPDCFCSVCMKWNVWCWRFEFRKHGENECSNVK